MNGFDITLDVCRGWLEQVWWARSLRRQGSWQEIVLQRLDVDIGGRTEPQGLNLVGFCMTMMLTEPVDWYLRAGRVSCCSLDGCGVAVYLCSVPPPSP